MSRIRDWFTKNIFWKLFSLFLAILVWFFVINIQNPTQTRAYDVAVTLEGLEALEAQKLTLTNQTKLENSRVQIRVSGKRMALDRLDDMKNEITATIDTIIMRGSRISDPINYSIDIQLPNTGPNDRFEVISKDPYSLDGSIDSIVTDSRKIDVFPTGTIAEGYDEISTDIRPAYIKLTGAESLINKVASIKVNVDIDGAKSDLTMTATPKLYDSLGNEILGVTRDIDEVEINIKISKYAKVPLVVTNRGTPKDGYMLTDFTWEPDYVELVGSEDAINAIKEMNITYNLQGRSESEDKLYDLRQHLPSTEISIKNGTPNEAVVHVTIKPLGQKQMMISTESVALTGRIMTDVEYHIEPKDIVFTVSGLKNIVQSVTADKITASVNVTNYAEGIHNIPLTMTFPSGITIISETPSVIVEIKSSDSDIDNIIDTTTTGDDEPEPASPDSEQNEAPEQN